MKPVFYMVLVLGALLVCASVDALPDPPAVNPHALDAKSSCLRDSVSDFGQQHVTGEWASIPVLTALCQMDSATSAEPLRPSDGIVVTGHAADSSPPLA
jgi:hypothetical protein